MVRRVAAAGNVVASAALRGAQVARRPPRRGSVQYVKRREEKCATRHWLRQSATARMRQGAITRVTPNRCALRRRADRYASEWRRVEGAGNVVIRARPAAQVCPPVCEVVRTGSFVKRRCMCGRQRVGAVCATPCGSCEMRPRERLRWRGRWRGRVCCPGRRVLVAV